MAVPVTVDTLLPGDTYGDLPLLQGEAGKCLGVVGGGASAQAHTSGTEDQDGSSTSRAGASGLQKSRSGAEILFVDRQDFFAIRMDRAFISLLEAKAEALRRSGAFPPELWPEPDLLRLASAAKVRTARAGEELVKQRGLPTALFVILRGLCTIYKASDELSSLNHALREAREQLDSLSYVYSYHHSMRGGSKLPLPAGVRAMLRQETGMEVPPEGLGYSSQLGLVKEAPSGDDAFDHDVSDSPGKQAVSRVANEERMRRPHNVVPSSV